jgi:hypothetical protein
MLAERRAAEDVEVRGHHAGEIIAVARRYSFGWGGLLVWRRRSPLYTALKIGTLKFGTFCFS